MTRIRYGSAIGLVSVAAIATAIAYSHVPNVVPVHWNFHGRIDRYGPKWMLFLLGPGVMAGTTALFAMLPWLSPKQFELNTFRATCARIMLAVVVVFGYLYGVLLWTALGHSADMSRVVLGGVCVLFAVLGNVMGKVRRNFYIGVRTPWTLASERVWNGTHRFAAKTFVIAGLVGLCLTLAGLAGWPVFALLGAGAVAPAGYSLLFYKKLERHGDL